MSIGLNEVDIVLLCILLWKYIPSLHFKCKFRELSMTLRTQGRDGESCGTDSRNSVADDQPVNDEERAP